MIRSFADRASEELFRRAIVRRFPPEIRRTALRKLTLIHAAASLDDLRSPPGNRLERLRGDRDGQYSIRINDQFRVCFKWEAPHAYDVQVTDYH